MEIIINGIKIEFQDLNTGALESLNSFIFDVLDDCESRNPSPELDQYIVDLKGTFQMIQDQIDELEG